jgi:hypothetical protein
LFLLKYKSYYKALIDDAKIIQPKLIGEEYYPNVLDLDSHPGAVFKNIERCFNALQTATLDEEKDDGLFVFYYMDYVVILLFR